MRRRDHAMASAPQATAPRRRLGGWTALEVLLATLIVAVLAAIAIPGYGRYTTKVKARQAGMDITVIQAAISGYAVENGGALPETLADIGASVSGMRDPWGRAYGYVNHTTEPKGKWRKDKNIVPINSDYDLYSLGADGGSSPPLTASSSRDDIIRANNGRSVGLASEYDP